MHLVALVVRLSGLDWRKSGLHGYTYLAGTTIQCLDIPEWHILQMSPLPFDCPYCSQR